MTAYPLLFMSTDVVKAGSFEAGVMVDGRALMVREDGEWWCSAVAPGGWAETGRSPQEAFQRFMGAYRELLRTMAATARDYPALRREVARLGRNTNEADARLWTKALDALRAGRAPEAPFDALPRRPGEGPGSVRVTKLDKRSRDRFALEWTTHPVAMPRAA
jgi:hypothetical protein